jgi:hypothetical protein
VITARSACDAQPRIEVTIAHLWVAHHPRVPHQETRAPAPRRTRRAPSEIVEPFRNLGRCPPGPPRRRRYCLPSNLLVPQGGNPGAPRAAGGGSVLALSRTAGAETSRGTTWCPRGKETVDAVAHSSTCAGVRRWRRLLLVCALGSRRGPGNRRDGPAPGGGRVPLRWVAGRWEHRSDPADTARATARAGTGVSPRRVP